MQDPQKLQEENERLIVELAAYKEAEKARKQKKGRFIKQLSSFGSWFFLGGDFKASIKKLVVEVRDKDKQLSNDTLGDVLAHGAWRFTWIGCFAIIMALIPLAILLIQTTLLYYQNQKFDTQNELFTIQNDKVTEQTNLIQAQNTLLTTQNRRLDQQTYLQEADRRSSLVFLFGNIMDAIDKELKEDYGNDNVRNLSPQLIGRIIALSTRLKPYKYLDSGDTLIGTPISPERGQLLVSLLESQLDNLAYDAIFSKGDFVNADLSSADFDQKYLKNINLRKSNLTSASLSNSDLRKAHFLSADLRRAHLRNSNLISADLRNANLEGAYLKRADLRKADLSFAKLNKADLRFTKLDSVVVDDLNFIKKLESWNINGIDSIKAKYYVDSLPSYNLIDKTQKRYYLIKEKKSN